MGYHEITMTGPKKFVLVIKVDEEEAEDKGAAQILGRQITLPSTEQTCSQSPTIRERGGANRYP